jgi:hypothetical protein
LTSAQKSGDYPTPVKPIAAAWYVHALALLAGFDPTSTRAPTASIPWLISRPLDRAPGQTYWRSIMESDRNVWAVFAQQLRGVRCTGRKECLLIIGGGGLNC